MRYKVVIAVVTAGVLVFTAAVFVTVNALTGGTEQVGASTTTPAADPTTYSYATTAAPPASYAPPTTAVQTTDAPPTVRLPQITVADHVNDDWATAEPMTDEDLDDLSDIIATENGPAEGDSITEWIFDQGGADIHLTQFTLSIKAIDPDVSLTGIRAEVLDRESILEGGVVWYEHGADDPPLTATLDLDGSAPTAPEFASRSTALRVGRTVKVVVKAHAIQSCVTWQLIADFSVAGSIESVTVDTGVSELRTTGRAGTTADYPPPGYDYADHYGTQAYAGSEEATWSNPGPF